MPPQPLPGILALPSGRPPFPAIIVLHGRGGRTSQQEGWATRLNGWGYAALIVDSHSPRGIHYNCAGPAEERPITPQDRAGDVISAALWLCNQPEIDAPRIGVIGFSNGGWTAVWVTQRRYEDLYPGLLKASVDYYGGCSHPQDHGMVPLLVLAGEADNWAFPAQHWREFGSKLTSSQIFKIQTYPGVVHCFDCSNLQGLMFSQGHPMEYDAAAANDSFIQTKAFLDHYVGHAAK